MLLVKPQSLLWCTARQSNTSTEIIFSEGNADRQLNDCLQLNKGNYITSLAFSHIILFSCIKLFNDLFLKRVISLLLIQWVTASAPTQTQARPCWRQCTIMWSSGSSARSLCPPGATPMLSPLPSPLPSCPAFLPCFSSQRRKRPSAREPLSCQHHTPTWN